MSILVQVLLGISYGMVLFLIAVGLSLILGLMGIVNLSHGAILVVGAFVGVSVAHWTENLLIGLLAGFLTSGLVGLIIERGFLRQLYHQYTDQILITLGFTNILLNTNEWVWGAMPRSPFIPPLLQGSVIMGEIQFPMSRLIIIFCGVIVCAILWWFQDKTRVGAIIRAQMHDEQMVSALGINSTPIVMSVFFVGSGLAAFGAIMGGPVLGGISTITANDLLWFALAVVIVGGIGSIQGAFVGALIIGILDNIGRTYWPDFAMYTTYIILIIALLLRPQGILGRRIYKEK